MKKLIVIALTGFIFAGGVIKATAVQPSKEAINSAKKARGSTKKIREAAEEAQDAVKKAHEKTTKLKEVVQKEKARGHSDQAVIKALREAENYASDLINKLVSLMESTNKAATHAKQTHKATKETHQALKEKATLVNVQAFSL